jgi:hypothetical protein
MPFVQKPARVFKLVPRVCCSVCHLSNSAQPEVSKRASVECGSGRTARLPFCNDWQRIEDCHHRELADIKAWKKKQKKRFAVRRQKDTDRVLKVIADLREKSKMIRSDNEDLQETREKLALVNQTIGKYIQDVLSKCDFLKECMKKI